MVGCDVIPSGGPKDRSRGICLCHQTSRLQLEVTGKYAQGDIKTVRMTTCTRDDRVAGPSAVHRTTALDKKSGMEKAANAFLLA